MTWDAEASNDVRAGKSLRDRVLPSHPLTDTDMGRLSTLPRVTWREGSVDHWGWVENTFAGSRAGFNEPNDFFFSQILFPPVLFYFI